MARIMVVETPPALAAATDPIAARGRWRHAKLRLNWHRTVHQMEQTAAAACCTALMVAEANARQAWRAEAV